jgi:hypothetical protein
MSLKYQALRNTLQKQHNAVTRLMASPKLPTATRQELSRIADDLASVMAQLARGVSQPPGFWSRLGTVINAVIVFFMRRTE